MKTHSFLFLSSIFLFVSCGPNSTLNQDANNEVSQNPNELTRDKAKDLIVKKYYFPQTETYKLNKKYLKREWPAPYRGGLPIACVTIGKVDTYDENRAVLSELHLKDMITIGEENEQREDESGSLWAIVLMTDAGKKYLINESSNQYEVKTSDIIFGEITGIKINEQFKIATVEYTLQRIHTPFGDAFTNNSSNKKVITQEKEFSLYDDGWRINK